MTLAGPCWWGKFFFFPSSQAVTLEGFHRDFAATSKAGGSSKAGGRFDMVHLFAIFDQKGEFSSSIFSKGFIFLAVKCILIIQYRKKAEVSCIDCYIAP